MAGGGQDRACALGWGEGFHPNRPKTVARNHTIPQISYECFKIDLVGYMRRRICTRLPLTTTVGRQLAHPEKGIEGEHVPNFIEAKAHDAE